MDKAKNGEVLYVKGMGQVGRMTDLNQSDESKLLINHNSPFFSMLADQQGRLWVSTLLGLSVYDENYNLIKNYTRADGLFDHLILSILEDKAGGIWVFTRNGANRFESQSEQFISFGYLDDLEIYPYSGLTTTVDEEGVVYVLGSKGVYAFFPERIEPDTIPPALIFTDFRVNNQAVNHSDSAVLKQTITYTDRVKLTYQQRNIAIEYAGIQNVANKIQYAYQLEGFDSDWIMAGNERVARYSNLPPGNYTFLVKAANADGAWMEEPARLGIRVRPPWWATIWAKAFYILLALALLIWFVQFQRAKVKAKQRELEREQELARQLEATNKRLAQMDKLKDQFLANTSHELRTPLTGIIGLSESLLDREEDLKKTQDLSMIISSGKRLASLVNDILDFSKLKNQELVLQKRPVDIHAAVEIVLALSQPLVKNKNLQLINQVPRDLALAEADENRVLQIFHNLIGNAIKFTEQGTVSVSAKEQDGLLEITVADTGIGIPEANLESIFKSFEQGDGSVAREYGGTGLGLSVSRQLIELHGGTITVASKVGIGTWFTFTLPVSEVEREAVDMLDQPLTAPDTIIKPEPEEPVVREPVPIPVRDGKPVKRMAFDDTIHILIVDDEPVNLQVLDNHLSLAGYEVSTANSGFEAMELIAQGRKFDLVVLDVMMPRMSGYEVCRKIRESYLTSELPVLILTAKNRASDLVQGFNIGANDYLTKPFSKSELLSRIRTHLHLNRINRATSKFVPHAFLRSIGREAITDVKLGDQAHQLVTVFFSDIRDYTSLSEQMTPEENFNFVNAYVGRMGPVIQKNRGFVNQYLGDAIMALFPPAADHALEASIAMQHLIQQYNQERIGQDRQPIKVGMGLHTGHLMMGIIGDNNRSEPATIADTVNIASRMEGLTKIYGANILLSEDSISRISNSEKFHFRSIGKVQLKGKKAPISIYECFDGDDPELKTFKLESLDQFEKGLKFFFNREFGQAQVAFNQIIKQNDGDQVAAYFHKRAARYAYEGVPEDWTGIEKMTMK